MKTLLASLAIPLGIVAAFASTRTARADSVVVTRPSGAKEQSSITEPNRTLLHSGLWTLGLSYIPAVIVAAGSSREGDKNLYIPVAGPWMNLVARSECPPGVSCNNETVNKVLIVIDGVFQGLGALDIVGAFIFPETRTVTVSSSEPRPVHLSSPSLRVLPARVGASAYGLAAIGTF